jgi:hypothetical protein
MEMSIDPFAGVNGPKKNLGSRKVHSRILRVSCTARRAEMESILTKHFIVARNNVGGSLRVSVN